MSGKDNPDTRADRINAQVSRQTGMTADDLELVSHYGKDAVEAAVQAGMALHKLHPTVTLSTIIQVSSASLGRYFGNGEAAELLHAYADFLDGKPDEARMTAILSRLSTLNAAKAAGGLN